MRIFNQIAATLALLSSAGFISACTNNSLSKVASKASNMGQSGANNVIINYGTFTIASVTVGTTLANSSSGYPVTIAFNTSTSGPSIANNCTANTGNAPCACKFLWNETNSTGGSTVTVSHSYFSDVTTVGSAQVGCSTPLSATWTNSIADNTSITISVVPATSGSTTNPNTFTVTPYAFTKNQSNVTGNFTDSMGRSFVNILRYSCYEQRQRGVSLLNSVASQTITNINSFNFLVSNKFCLRNAQGIVKGGDNCASVVPAATYSAQSYYYNMYVRDNESGDINPGNALFVCPQVTEALNQQGTAGSQGKYWPLDSSFALSLGKTSDFSVGVVAHTKTTNSSDPTAQNSTCDSNTTTTPDANSLVSSCLGFAAKPNVNGSCPGLPVDKVSGSCPSGSFPTSTGCMMPTYRLRKYVALYPSIYDTDGNILTGEAQRLDTIYVLDRPVVDSGGNIISDSSGSPYSMLGPKPCPFSYFDSANITGAGVGYHGTNHSGWDDKNVDNIFFPYQDTGSGYAGTCAAILPQLDATGTKVQLTTLTSKKYVRPGKSWAAHYEEDTSFQACAPQSNPLRDPPLHFAYNGTNMAWCAEVYPTQNDNYTKLVATGLSNPIINTGHLIHNGSAASSCTTNAITGHSGGATCERTVVNPSNGVAWMKFPVLAPEAEVTKALQSDASFGCTMTYDNSGGKVNSSDFSLGKTPTQGCCANAAPPTGAGKSAHLEPYPAPTTTPAVYTPECTPPQY
jgi:hypothetical protein